MSSPQRLLPALRPVAIASALALQAFGAAAQTAAEPAPTLGTVTVEASADASAEGLAKPFAGGQVARGARAGILGTQDVMDSPFSTTSYTHELIQNQQARSVADVLQNDPSVRVARGFGNFQESYFIRGFVVNSDDIAYNGLYGLLPRQYISSELFERVEVLRGASAFLNGATPSGGGIGGNINLLPKRAPNDPLTQVTLGTASGSQSYLSTDIARRFGPDQSVGVRLNAAHRDGGTGVDAEQVKLDVIALGLDWRSRNARISADVGHQEHRLSRTRPNVTLGSGLSLVPAAPDNTVNYAQPWTYSNERDTFGSVRGEYDITDNLTAWVAARASTVRERVLIPASAILARSSPTFHSVTPPRLFGMGSRPSRAQRHTVGMLTLNSAATTGTRAPALSGSLSKCWSAEWIGAAFLPCLVVMVAFTLMSQT